MTDFDNTNRGSIWKNERKTKDTHPDFTGTLNVEGREYFFDAWKRKEGAPAKAPALSFKIKPKDAQPGGSPDRFAKPKGAEVDLDDSIPF
jgi:hypothetical protein